MLDPAAGCTRSSGTTASRATWSTRNKPTGFETVCVTWGPGGTTLHRNGVDGRSPKGDRRHLVRPGHRGAEDRRAGVGRQPAVPRRLAELRVYNRPLTEAERKQVEAELRDAWFQPDDPKKPPRDPLAELYDELLSPRGPFWLAAGGAQQAARPRGAEPARGDARRAGRACGSKPPAGDSRRRSSVQDGGPKGTRHEGFKDAQVFIRGDHKRLGKTVPRGFPKVLTGEREEQITEGSGRLQLADWLARPDNPLTARVMVNRIWQHHFGEGLVRTPNDFGERGERPTHPELLDYLAARFVESGGR